MIITRILIILFICFMALVSLLVARKAQTVALRKVWISIMLMWLFNIILLIVNSCQP